MEQDIKIKQGFIVAICGGPGTGKSTLVKKLVKHYQAVPIFEGEEKDFPQRLKDNLKNNENHLEIMIYFRNLLTRMHLEATKHKAEGKLVIMDTFWLTNDIYANTWLENDFQKELMQEVSKLDSLFLDMPDLIICLQAGKELVKNFMTNRGRSFEGSSDVMDRFVAAGEAHYDFFKTYKNTIFVNRSELDFYDHEHFSKITEIIDNKILNK